MLQNGEGDGFSPHRIDSYTGKEQLGPRLATILSWTPPVFTAFQVCSATAEG